MTLIGLALIAANLYANSRPVTGRGTPEDPYRSTTVSPLLALAGALLILLED